MHVGKPFKMESPPTTLYKKSFKNDVILNRDVFFLDVKEDPVSEKLEGTP